MAINSDQIEVVDKMYLDVLLNINGPSNVHISQSRQKTDYVFRSKVIQLNLNPCILCVDHLVIALETT